MEPRHKAVTTTTVASELASWWAETDDLCIPWLYNTTRWGVIQAELLLDRATPAHVRSLWPLIAKFAEPEETIAAADDLIEMAGWIGREDRARHVLDTAAHFVGSPTALDTIDGMLSAPHVKIAVAELAVRVAHDDDEDPVIVSQGVLRLAARFSGLTVDRVNKRSAGRIAVARLIGAGELGDSAHLALLELAERTCVPRRPRCTECPLGPWCVEHAGEPRKTRATTRSR